MSRPRTATNILMLKGAFDKDPKRLKAREGEPLNTKPIGKPSKTLNAIEKEAFNEIVKLSIDGVLGESDKIAVELAAVLLVKCRGLATNDDDEIFPATAAEQGILLKYLGQFGMTPSERSKINIPQPKKKNPFTE